MKIQHVAKAVGNDYVIRNAEGKLIAIYSEGILMIDGRDIAASNLDEAMEIVGNMA